MYLSRKEGKMGVLEVTSTAIGLDAHGVSTSLHSFP